MKKIILSEVPFEKIKNREGLAQRHLVDKSKGINNFTFHQARMEKGGMGSLHNHPDIEHFLLVISGELELSNEEENHRVPAGTGLIVYPGEYHEVRNVNDGITEYYVMYSPPREG